MTGRRAARAAGGAPAHAVWRACSFVCKAGDDRNAEVIGMSVLDMHRVAMTRKPVQCHAFRAVCVGPSRASHPKSRYPEPLGMPLQPNWLGGGSSLTAARCFRFIE